MREEILTIIKNIVSTEKFKMDAYFMCGNPTDKPNQELLKACEKYLETPEEKALAEDVIAEIEKIVAPVVEAVGAESLPKYLASLKEVLDNKECLLG